MPVARLYLSLYIIYYVGVDELGKEDVNSDTSTLSPSPSPIPPISLTTGTAVSTKTALQLALEEEEKAFVHINPSDYRFLPSGATKDIHLKDVTLTVAGTELLTLTTLALKHGHRYGLIGKNGCGKSTRNVYISMFIDTSHLYMHTFQL